PSGLTGPLALCAGENATFSLDAVAGETYAWELPAAWSGDVSGDSINVVVAAPGGTLTVVGTNSCGAGTAASIEVVTAPLPEVLLNEFALLCVYNAPFTLTGGTPAGGNYTFNGVPITSFNPIVGIGSYPITYTVVDTNGCTASATQVLEVDACAGIEENSLVDLRVHPNPANSGMLFVDAPGPGDLVLFDAAGRVALQARHDGVGLSSSLSIERLSPGSYVLTYRSLAGEVGHARVIVGR
ncbi:MAG: hypothetical protein WEC15_03455, partial [Flavobacteriales bacterium]